MKRVIFALLAIAIITSCAKNNKVNFTIDGTLANGIEAEGDTAYLFLTDYGSATFVDSCRIENGKFNLKANIPFDGFIGYVIIGNHEGSSGLFIVDRDENLTMEYTPSADYEQAVVGGSARYDEYKEMQKQLEPILAIGDDIFTRIRAMQIDDPQIAIIADSIDMISAQRKEMMYEQTMNATHAFNAISGAMSFEGDARKVDIDQYVIETFGDYRLIGFLTNKLPSGEEPAPLSEEAAQALNRYDILTGNLPRYPDGAPTDSDNEVKVEETVIIAPPGKTIEPAKPMRYKTGDTILAFEFELLVSDKTNINTSSSNHRYFWR